MSHPVDEILQAQKRGEIRGITSICSAHPWVLKTALRGRSPVLIESTCNQVNQFGGYSGLNPQDFAMFVHRLAAENNFPSKDIILGGDHLGPSPWQDEPSERAMTNAFGMVEAYIQAGFTKIHLDTSMRLGGDDPAGLVAHRTTLLVKAAEAIASPLTLPRYIIGTEVPLPGGATVHEENVKVTMVEDVRRTLEIMRSAFVEAQMEAAWQRVIAVVVQPGIEFGDDFILDFNPSLAFHLARYSEITPLIYEAHSTDYQTRENLHNLVSDHFAILKVGPALTFAFRQAVFALAMMESELLPVAKRSCLIETLDMAMQREPFHWKKYYHGDERQIAFARKYSFSDRARYYWGDIGVQAALKLLFANLDEVHLPLALISQYLPEVYSDIRTGVIANSAGQIVIKAIQSVLDDYSYACGESCG
jgi:D-tagatose-1,6-bisphosphate aldolase subunit GatZ/KbaZ